MTSCFLTKNRLDFLLMPAVCHAQPIVFAVNVEYFANKAI